MEENDVKGTCGGTRLDFKIEKGEKFQFQNLTRCKFFIQNLRVVKFLNQNVTRCKNFV